jgi:hypothetical protein
MGGKIELAYMTDIAHPGHPAACTDAFSNGCRIPELLK